MRLSTMALVLLTTTLCSSFAFAANQTRVDIPFSFSAMGKAFPPGSYDISIDENLRVVSLTNKDIPADFILRLTTPADSVDIRTPTVLTFRIDGSSHSLETIRIGRRSASLLSTSLKRTTEPSIQRVHGESISTYSDMAVKTR